MFSVAVKLFKSEKYSYYYHLSHQDVTKWDNDFETCLGTKGDKTIGCIMGIVVSSVLPPIILQQDSFYKFIQK